MKSAAIPKAMLDFWWHRVWLFGLGCLLIIVVLAWIGGGYTVKEARRDYQWTLTPEGQAAIQSAAVRLTDGGGEQQEFLDRYQRRKARDLRRAEEDYFWMRVASVGLVGGWVGLYGIFLFLRFGWPLRPIIQADPFTGSVPCRLTCRGCYHHHEDVFGAGVPEKGVIATGPWHGDTFAVACLKCGMVHQALPRRKIKVTANTWAAQMLNTWRKEGEGYSLEDYLTQVLGLPVNVVSALEKGGFFRESADHERRGEPVGKG